MDDECEVRPELIVIADTYSNSRTSSYLKVSDIRNTKLSGITSQQNNTPDHSTSDKKSYAKCRTRKREWSNTKDWTKECNDNPKIIVITGIDGNSGTKGKFKVIDNS